MTSDELLALSREIFLDHIVPNTTGPQDAAELMLYLHVRLWKSQEPQNTATAMLDAFNLAFLEMIGEGPTIQ